MSPTLTEDTPKEILHRVASPANLDRTFAVCVSFCRLIADPSFVRWYRSLYPPLLLGFIDSDGLHPVPPPHPNAPAARAFARIVNFDFHYLPCDGHLLDLRDGRILVELLDEGKDNNILLLDLTVCDPMSRRYRPVPPIPDEALASAQIQEHDIVNLNTFLVPFGNYKETSLRVIRCILVKTGLVLFVFSSGSGHWSVSTSTSWDALSLDAPKAWMNFLDIRRYMHGCFYWKVNHRDKLLKLDMNSMKLCTHDLLPDQAERRVVIVQTRDGKLVMFSLIDEGTSLGYYKLATMHV